MLRMHNAAGVGGECRRTAVPWMRQDGGNVAGLGSALTMRTGEYLDECSGWSAGDEGQETGRG